MNINVSSIDSNNYFFWVNINSVGIKDNKQKENGNYDDFKIVIINR